jgi:cytochrome c oxidase assembly protein subunit 11
MNAPLTNDKKLQRRNGRVAVIVMGVVAGMVGLSYASVPLYEIFCRMTGFGGTPQIAKTESALRGEKVLSVRFDANIASDLPWSFEPDVPAIKLRTGETATIFYKVKNKSDHETIGIASYNVAPERAGMFFNKISCFCFSEQRLGPGETMDMPVVFYLDPALEKDEIMKLQDQVTLSYTFYASRTPVTASRAKPAL